MSTNLMYKETGRVVAVDEQGVWVETIQRSACGACSAKSGCGQSVLNRMYDGRRQRMLLPTDHLQRRPQLGDAVTLAIPEHALLRGALLVYLLPLASLIVGAMIGVMVGSMPGSASSETASLTGAVVGFALGLLLVKRICRYVQGQGGLQPVLLEDSICTHDDDSGFAETRH